jgi:hypothetical protein
MNSASIIRMMITLMMEAVLTSETSVYFNETTRRYIPEDYSLHLLFCLLGPATELVLCQINPVHLLRLCSIKTHFIIILTSVWSSPKSTLGNTSIVVHQWTAKQFWMDRQSFKQEDNIYIYIVLKRSK